MTLLSVTAAGALAASRVARGRRGCRLRSQRSGFLGRDRNELPQRAARTTRLLLDGEPVVVAEPSDLRAAAVAILENEPCVAGLQRRAARVENVQIVRAALHEKDDLPIVGRHVPGDSIQQDALFRRPIELR